MQKVLIVSEKCPSCALIKEKADPAKYTIVDIGSERGRLLAEKLDLKGVPECIVVDVEQNRARICSDEEWKDVTSGK